MQVHKLITELINKGLTVALSQQGYSLDGFYKSGTVVFSVKDDQTLLCSQRYDEVDEVQSFDDLVRINFKWLKRSEARGWSYPDGFWVAEYKRLGLIQ